MTFDLEKARDAAKFDDHMAITMFPLAIAEIERLRASLVEHEEHENQTHEALGNILGTDDALENVAKRAAARIKELKADLEQSERVIEARLDVIDQQAARIKELKANCIYDLETGKVFVPDGHPELEKLRARNRDLEDAHKRSGAKYAKIINELRSSVYANMPGLKKQWDDVLAEGKIGPDDSKKISHLRPYEVVAADLAGMLAKSWRITDERVEALWHAIKVLKENDIMEEPEEHLWDEEVTVLQAMLTEAGIIKG